MVSLPFDRDQGGVKLGFKTIRQSNLAFQNELIHIDLDLSPELLATDQIIAKLLDALQIDESTGNLSMPHRNENRVALFTIMVATEELGVDVVEAKEVIAIYQNDSEIAGSAELDNGVVVIQSMQNAKNKVTIPIKKRSRKVTLDDLKYNL